MQKFKHWKKVALLPILAIMGAWGYLEYHFYVDYGGIAEILWDEVTGQSKPMTCIDLKNEGWRNVPKCNPALREPAKSEDKPHKAYPPGRGEDGPV